MRAKSDNKLDQDIAKNKMLMDRLTLDVQKFINNHDSLPAKDRALALKNIQRGFRELEGFLSKSHAASITAAAQKFSLENLKSSYASLTGRWIRFEKSLG
jgi:hypothetical protein